MKKLFLIVILTSLYNLSIAQELVSEKDSLSYALGITIGTQLEADNLDINPEIFAKAIESVKNQQAGMTLQDAQNFIGKYFSERAEKVANENKTRGQNFLNENKTKENVVTLPSGIQYTVLKTGDGEKPGLEDRVKVHYTGTTLDGNKFDSSVDRGEPAVFGITQVIKGWTEILQLMPTGSKWKVFIPDTLAYGTQAPPAIGPNQTLIFDIELLDIIKNDENN